jgi:hypothetical protein
MKTLLSVSTMQMLGRKSVTSLAALILGAYCMKNWPEDTNAVLSKLTPELLVPFLYAVSGALSHQHEKKLRRALLPPASKDPLPGEGV